MSASGWRLAPDLAEVLEEVARDPRSTLLRPGRAPTRGLLEVTPDHGLRRALLTEAERHLVEAYREEVAWLLVRACAYTNHVGAASRVVFLAKTADESFPIPDRLELQQSAARLSETGIDDGGAAAGLGLVIACVSGSGRASLGDLAEASLRLVPSVDARIYGFLHLIDAEPASAPAALDRLPTAGGSSRLQRSLLQSRGLLAYRTERFGDAARFYRESFFVNEQRVAGLLFWLVNAHWAGDTDDVRQAARRIDSVLSPGCAAATEFVQALRAERTLGRLPGARPDRRDEPLGLVSRSLLDETQ